MLKTKVTSKETKSRRIDSDTSEENNLIKPSYKIPKNEVETTRKSKRIRIITNQISTNLENAKECFTFNITQQLNKPKLMFEPILGALEFSLSHEVLFDIDSSISKIVNFETIEEGLIFNCKLIQHTK